MDDKLVQRILDACDAVPVAKLTQDLVRIPSYRWSEMEVADFAGDYMRKLGCEVSMQPVQKLEKSSQQAIGVIKGSGGAPSMMFCGHLDANCSQSPTRGYTADKDGWYYYRPDLWTKPPFSGIIEDGYVCGIGSVNMKGGVAAMLAAEALKNAGVKLKGDLTLAAVMAETGGGVGVSHLVDSGIRSDYAIVTECTNMSVVNISVAACRGLLHFEGRTMHHTPYANPAEHAARVVTAMGHTFVPAEQGGWLTFTPNPELPGYPRSTARSINSDGDFVTVMFEVRNVPGMNDDTVRADMERLLDGVRKECPDLKATIVLPSEPYILNRPAAPGTPLDSPIVTRTAAWHERVANAKPLVGAGDRLGGAADAANLRMAGIPTVEYGPGNAVPWPMVDERCSIADIITSTKVIALTAAELCM